MTSVRQLKLAHGAGDADPCPALRVDVVAAAVKWYEARDHVEIDAAEDALATAVRRYRAAVKRRARGLGPANEFTIKKRKAR